MIVTTPTPPPAVTWQKVYCGVMAGLYGLLLLVGIALTAFSGVIATSDPTGPPAPVFVMMGLIYGGLGGVLAGLFLAGVFLPPRPWAWIFHIVLIALGLTSCCTWPATIPLLIFWIKPETQAWFGRGPIARP